MRGRFIRLSLHEDIGGESQYTQVTIDSDTIDDLKFPDAYLQGVFLRLKDDFDRFVKKKKQRVASAESRKRKVQRERTMRMLPEYQLKPF